jgi:hypothetical protein
MYSKYICLNNKPENKKPVRGTGFLFVFNKTYPCNELAKSNSSRIEIKEIGFFDDKIFISAPYL